MMLIADIKNQLINHQVIAVATETVVGLSTLITQPALAHLYNLKQRSRAQGIIIVSKYVEHFLPFVDFASISAEQFRTLTRTYQSPRTFLVPAQPNLEWLIGDANHKIAVRLVRTGLLSVLTEELNQALTSTSANISGYPPANSMQELKAYFLDKVIYTDLEDYFAANAMQPRKPSTIIDLMTNEVIRHA